MEVTLNIPNPNDWFNIEPLLKRLGITVISSKNIETTQNDWNIILKGIKKENFDGFLNDFEDSRKDRELPFR